MTENQDQKVSDTTKKLSETDKQLIKSYRERVDARHTSPKLKVENKPGEASSISTAGEDRFVSTLALLEAFGTTSLDLQSYLMREIIDAACSGSRNRPYEESAINGVIAAMHGINPSDEIESMLASQMVATHFAAMRCFRALKNSESVPQQDSNGNLAIKLMRTYTAQMEALQRYRGKGQQKMTVEHVHVHPGGQAIVGNVTHPEGVNQ